MAPLVVLLATFVLFLGVNRFALGGRFGLSLIGRISMAAMLVVTGVSHFTSTDAMVAMIPDGLPAKWQIVYFTGILEIAAAAGLVWLRTSRLTAIMLIIFFLAVLPANIVGSFKQVELGGMEYGPAYLLFRVPLQLFFIWWAWYYGLRRNTRTTKDV